jgi:hypothetical protein
MVSTTKIPKQKFMRNQFILMHYHSFLVLKDLWYFSNYKAVYLEYSSLPQARRLYVVS